MYNNLQTSKQQDSQKYNPGSPRAPPRVPQGAPCPWAPLGGPPHYSHSMGPHGALFPEKNFRGFAAKIFFRLHDRGGTVGPQIYDLYVLYT